MTRGTDDLLADLAEAADAAAEIVMLGKERWDAERPLRLAGEAFLATNRHYGLCSYERLQRKG